MDSLEANGSNEAFKLALNGANKTHSAAAATTLIKTSHNYVIVKPFKFLYFRSRQKIAKTYF